MYIYILIIYYIYTKFRSGKPSADVQVPIMNCVLLSNGQRPLSNIDNGPSQYFWVSNHFKNGGSFISMEISGGYDSIRN